MGEDLLGRIKSLPLSCLPVRTRELLSCLLDTPKIIPTDGPVKLPRDWRGLADLVNVSSERAAYIRLQPQKTVKVLEIWQRDSSATVGHLMQHLERLDRFDVYDDLCDDLKDAISKGELLDKPQVNEQNQIAINNNKNNNNNSHHHNSTSSNDEERVFDPITYDDGPDYEHHYDAFVLYAKEDQKFVDELLTRMSAEGFQLCTADRLQPGHATPYAPITKIMLERCKRIILICSPDFLLIKSNKYYSEYAQAVSIESHTHKIIPIMYRECTLPSNLAFYHRLHYNENEERAMYDFWLKLKQSLQFARAVPSRPRITNDTNNRLNGTTTSVPQVKIVELPPSNAIPDYSDDHLFLPSPPTTSVSMNSLNVQTAADTNSLSSMSQKSVTSTKKKKKSKIIRGFRSLLTYIRPSKSEEAIMVAH